MDFGSAIGLVSAVWLVGALILMGRSIRRGQDLAEVLSRRYPEAYEALGRPRPGWFDSARRRRFARYVGNRLYEDLDDRRLSERFASHRRSEARALAWILASGVLICVIGLAGARLLP